MHRPRVEARLLIRTKLHFRAVHISGMSDRIIGWILKSQTGKLIESQQLTDNPGAIDETVPAEIAKSMAAAEEIVIFTGSGISSESGVPTFRDGATGLWNNIDPEIVASIQGFEKRPERVWVWHVQMRKLIDGGKPNLGHHAIAHLERHYSNKRISVITQNIDGFHQMAGSSRVFELRGSIRRIRCHRNCSYVELWETPDRHPATCPQCDASARPDVVPFGEPLNDDLFSNAEAAASNADVLISVRTSANVRPAGGLPLTAKMSGAVVVEVNPHETPCSGQASHSIRTTATAFFSRLLERIDA